MKKAGICGPFNGKQGGQTVKVRIIASELKKIFGNDEIMSVDTSGGLKTIWKQLWKAVALMKQCENIIICLSANGVRIFLPFLAFLNMFRRRQRRLHYVVIGGWLPEFVKKRKSLGRCLNKFHYVYVETSTMKRAMEAQGYRNVVVMPNSKDLPVLSEDELVYPEGIPLKLCTFSRVVEGKGIEDAVQITERVNNQLGYMAFTLDIYGPIQEEDKEWFENIQKNFPKHVNYKGCADADKSVEILRNYFALLFPTHFYTEGIPGTIIDAYAAGLPVIASKWESYSDVIEEGKTGIGYEFDNTKAFEDVLTQAINNPKMLSEMKLNCIAEANKFRTNKVIQVLAGRLESEKR